MSRMDNFRALLRMGDVPVVVAMAFVTYFAMAYLIVARWHIMPITPQRIVAIKKFLDQRANPKSQREIYCLGSSVVIEGLDCDIVDAELTDGRHCYNFGWTGAGFRQWLLILPAITTAQPEAVVLCTDFFSLVGTNPISETRMNIAAWWDFIPEQDLDSLSTVLSESELSVLHSSRAEQLIRFRALPLGALNVALREMARSDLRYEGYTTNFKNPWVRRKSVSPAILERHLEQCRKQITERTDEQCQEVARLLRAVVDRLLEKGCQPILVLTPINPELLRRLGDEQVNEIQGWLQTLSDQTGVTYLDHSTVLSVEEYSDAVHPFENGRRHWSAHLGQELRSLAAKLGG